MMKEPTVSELKDAKVKLEKDIQQLLNTFNITNGVTVSNLRLSTHLVRDICGNVTTFNGNVEVEIIL